jgi:hypothetical protein
LKWSLNENECPGHPILFLLVVAAMIIPTEFGYGVLALFMLFPAIWLMGKAFEDTPVPPT